MLYAYFAIYIGQAFFPVAGEFGPLLASVAAFGVGFFTRPLGSLLIGAFADRVGRKPALILTVVLITIGTLGIAATPSYAAIGIAAPIIVVVCRLLQGLALGGEIGPATALLLELAPPGKRGFYTSWQMASQGLAVAVGGLLRRDRRRQTLSPQDLASWGWRLPFLFSLVLVPIAIYIRRSLPETLTAARQRIDAADRGRRLQEAAALGGAGHPADDVGRRVVAVRQLHGQLCHQGAEDAAGGRPELRAAGRAADLRRRAFRRPGCATATAARC